MTTPNSLGRLQRGVVGRQGEPYLRIYRAFDTLKQALRN